MKKIISILSISLAVLTLANFAQAVPPKPAPLQPANQPEIFDFTGQVNDPDSPGNNGVNPATGETAAEQDKEENFNGSGESGQTILDANSGNGEVDSFSIIAIVVVVLASASLAGAYYWYKTRKNNRI